VCGTAAEAGLYNRLCADWKSYFDCRKFPAAEASGVRIARDCADAGYLRSVSAMHRASTLSPLPITQP